MHDANYLREIIRRIEHEMSLHAQKFAGDKLHENCLPRFEAALAKLRQELEKASHQST